MMTPAQMAVSVEIADDADIEAAVERAVAASGVSLDDLANQARSGRFHSENARLAWFAISPFVDHGSG
jgi:hypothetical protein